MGTKVTTKTNETSTNAPPTWAAPGLEALGGRITDIIPTMPGPRYTGDFVAPTSDMERAIPGAYGGTANFLRGMVDPTYGVAFGSLNNMPSFSMEGPQPRTFASYDASAIQPVINAAIEPARRSLMENVLPSLRSSGIDSGAYGSTRASTTLPQLAIRDFSTEANRIGQGIAYQDFSDLENRRLQAYGLDTERGLGTANVMSQRLSMFPDLIDTVLRMQTGATDADAAAAAYDRQLRQNEIDNTLSQFDYNIRYPFQGLDVAAALLGNLAQPWGTRTTTGSSTQSSGGLGQFVQGAMGLGMMAMGMPGGAGGLSSLFSRKPTPSVFGSYPTGGAVGM